jgi:hypothetical protein
VREGRQADLDILSSESPAGQGPDCGYDRTVSETEPGGRRRPLSPEELRERRNRARARAAIRRRRAVAVLAIAVVLVVAAHEVLSSGSPAGGLTAAGHGGTRSAHHAAAPKPVRIVVEASGDLLIHSPVWDQALVLGGGNHYNFAPLFSHIKPYIERADLPLCHVETPMTPSPPTGYPIFNTPPELATAIHQTGWRACSTAATHSLDQGQRGIDDTVKALNDAGVFHTGSFASAVAQRTPLIINVKGIPVAFLSYTELTNGIPSPHPWSVNRANASQIIADAHRARQAGARVVVVNIHWGDENVPVPSGFQMNLARKLTASPDITAVVGQHVHVPQPIRTINGKLVVFGEGNLISNQTVACCPEASQDGMIALLTIVVTGQSARVTFVHYVPIWVQHPSFDVLPAGIAWRTDTADAAALRASYRRTVAVVGRGPDVQPIPDHLG